LVIGLGVGLLVVELGVQWLGISQKQWNTTKKSLVADRNSRTLFLSLKQDLNACGYRGLRQGDAHYPVETASTGSVVTTVKSKPVSTAYQAFDSKWRSRLLPDSDILEIADIPAAHCAIERQASDFLQIKKNGNEACRVNAGVRGLIADAQGAVWLHVADVDKIRQRIIIKNKTHRTYGKGAIFTPVEQVIYFVARSSRPPKKRYALWRRVKDRQSEELLEGITLGVLVCA
jgi:hypothetical protein